jgi:integrase
MRSPQWIRLEFALSAALGTKANLLVRSRRSNSRDLGYQGPPSDLLSNTRILALFNLGIDSKLRACDLLKLKIQDVCHGERVGARAIVVQQKTSRPVQFEITEPTRTALADWIRRSDLAPNNFLFPSRMHASPHLSTRQYARIVDLWVEQIGLDPAAYGTHSIRRTKPSLIYRRTKNLRAVQLLLGHTKLESTLRYLGIEVEDALELAEQTEV